MTAEELVAQAAENRLEQKRVDIRDALVTILEALLESCDYDANLESAPAMFARMIAAAIASIDYNRSLS